MLNDIKFIKGRGGLGRPLAGKDYISGLLFFVANGFLPTGFTTSNRIKQIFSVQDAVDLGINGEYNDETRATGLYSFTVAGATGDVITLKFTEPNGRVVDLASYIKKSTDTTTTLLATGVTEAINALTYIHGYSATSAIGVVTIRAKKGLGIYPNTGTPLSAVVTGTITGTITQFTGGVASLQAVWFYHISEFFRLQPKGFLWLNFQPVPTVYDFLEVKAMQEFANGAIRQIGIYADSRAYTVADTTALQSIKNTLDAQKMPLSIVLAPNIAGMTVNTLTDLATLNNSGVSVVIGQDGGALGNLLYKASGKSITTLGATLGTIALSSTHENIAWVGKFDQSNGTELESIAFANGLNFTDPSVSSTLLDAIDLKRYIFLRKFPNLAGSYYNDSHTATSPTSDYAYIENNRVIDKAIRGVYASLLPDLNSPLLLKANGELANSTVASMESKANENTSQMVRDGEASAIGVTIDPVQNVASTSTVYVSIRIVPIGVARNIIVNIGFKTSL